MQHRVVISDPTGDIPPGEIVEGRKAELLVAKHIPSLPIDPQLLRRNGAAGYTKREYGRGVAFVGNSSQRACQATLYVMPSHQAINWCAAIAPNRAHAHVKGRIRLANDPSQVNVIKAGIATAQYAEVDEEVDGQLVISGSSRFITSMEGFLGVSLYGTLSDARVLWLAVSQSKE